MFQALLLIQNGVYSKLCSTFQCFNESVLVRYDWVAHLCAYAPVISTEVGVKAV